MLARFRRATRTTQDPRARSALAWMGTVLCSARRRTWVEVSDRDGIWAHHHRDGILFFPEVSAISPAALARQATEIFLWEHVPGPGATVIDVGAAVGEETLTFSRHVGRGGRVIAVEAHPRTYACLDAAVRANGCTNVTTLQVAVAGEEGTLEIADGVDFLGNSVVTSGGTIEVRAVTLETLLAEQGVDRIDLLKLNIEGAETPALANTTVLERVDHIVVSCHDFKADQTGEEAYRTREDVRRILLEAGFQVLDRPEHPHPWVRDTLYGRRDPSLS